MYRSIGENFGCRVSGIGYRQRQLYRAKIANKKLKLLPAIKIPQDFAEKQTLKRIAKVMMVSSNRYNKMQLEFGVRAPIPETRYQTPTPG
jgi:hypothetical protein